MNIEDSIRQRFLAVRDHLHERAIRILVASEARSLGYGGIVIVSRATCIAKSTIRRGLKDIDAPDQLTGEIRRPGAGRPTLIASNPDLLEELRALVEPATMGDPMRPLIWVSKSYAKLADALKAKGYRVCPSTVATLLDSLGFRRQVNRKTLEGASHPDRDEQFEYINATVQEFIAAKEPVISVDTKKKENIGDFKNQGSDYRPKGSPNAVRVHDFIDKVLGKAIPHGIYDIQANRGWVTLGLDKDTAEFAVNSLRLWWRKVGSILYPDATRLMITADGGGSNGSRVGLWKVELQKFANETGIAVTVCHYPPGTSKWNKIEHRLFCHITQNWRGRPLTSCMAIIELICATTTKTGLKVLCELDERTYEKGIKVSQEELDALNIVRSQFHPEWNYTIFPIEHKLNQERALIFT